MEKVQILMEALNFIENNLTEALNTEKVASHLYCSKSTIEKLFRYIGDTSIRDYIIRRRMSLAAKDMVNFPEKSLLDIGVEYGYGSNEAFTRAFRGVWHVSPSEFRKNPSDYELFPAYKLDRELLEEKSMSDRKKVDISELYDCIKGRTGCFLVMGDIKHLAPINEISYKAGDLAIITSLKRMENAAGPGDVVFRIGGDEFLILTNSKEESYAEKICEKILRHNGECINWKGREIPLSMYVKKICYEGGTTLRYSEFFMYLHNEMNEDFKGI